VRGARRRGEQLEDLADRRRFRRLRILHAELLGGAREGVDRARDREQPVALATDHSVPVGERLAVGGRHLVELAGDEREPRATRPARPQLRDLGGHEGQLEVAVAKRREHRARFGRRCRLALRGRAGDWWSAMSSAAELFGHLRELRSNAVVASERAGGRELLEVRCLSANRLGTPNRGGAAASRYALNAALVSPW